RTAAAALLGAATVLGGSLALRSGGETRPVPSGSDSMQLAVIPFRDLTGDPRGQLMGDGFVATISVRLWGVPGLPVVTPQAAVRPAATDQEARRRAGGSGASPGLVATCHRGGRPRPVHIKRAKARGQGRRPAGSGACCRGEGFPRPRRRAHGVLRA